MFRDVATVSLPLPAVYLFVIRLKTLPSLCTLRRPLRERWDQSSEERSRSSLDSVPRSLGFGWRNRLGRLQGICTAKEGEFCSFLTAGDSHVHYLHTGRDDLCLHGCWGRWRVRAVRPSSYSSILNNHPHRPPRSVICQVAKAEGLRVIASAGSDSKVAFLKEIGVDVAFNYKKQDVGTVLKENGGVDIYWDHVGGKTLETVMGCMNKYGRIVVCPTYNSPFHCVSKGIDKTQSCRSAASFPSLTSPLRNGMPINPCLSC